MSRVRKGGTKPTAGAGVGGGSVGTPSGRNMESDGAGEGGSQNASVNIQGRESGEGSSE